MKNIKKNKHILILTLFLSISLTLFSQNNGEKKLTNAEYVIEIMNKKTINKIYMVATNMHRTYEGDWLRRMKAVGESLYFYRGNEKEHRWNTENTIFIEQYKDVIKIRMTAEIGE